jgi:hypothetical protein
MVDEQAGPVESCEGCRFYVGGGCHRRPPLPLAHVGDVPASSMKIAWPQMDPADWCGEFERR